MLPYVGIYFYIVNYPLSTSTRLSTPYSYTIDGRVQALHFCINPARFIYIYILLYS
ncbi:hypothetical protein SAMN06272722_1011023 [Paenibacillus sp. RU5A]|nr:hypothetical protein SAMN06272722_1011023 [Paenibacillus sp. RU5A]SOC58625.1 hypothetical protein SAMN05880581_101167 [Paenibacillus sp. RU26A]SOC67677.1 hypothetical protein SAMN05880586_101167 [Paenibacillus sp. RU5M]